MKDFVTPHLAPRTKRVLTPPRRHTCRNEVLLRLLITLHLPINPLVDLSFTSYLHLAFRVTGQTTADIRTRHILRIAEKKDSIAQRVKEGQIDWSLIQNVKGSS
jgi:hypothetical protein